MPAHRSRPRPAGAAIGNATVPPTPQTVARLRHDVVGRLLAHGRLDRFHADAAEEIRMVCEAIGRGMSPTALPTEWAGRPGEHRFARDFLDRMTAEERRLWERCYLPWTREILRAGDGRLSGSRWLRLVLDVVVENSGLRVAERRVGLRNGAGLGYLATGLERYERRRLQTGARAGFG